MPRLRDRVGCGFPLKGGGGSGGVGTMKKTRVTMTERSRRFGQGGQVVVLFMLVSVVLVGMVGLVVDSGTSYVHSRTLQAATDVAAESGDVLLTADLKTNTALNPVPYSTADICTAIETSISSTGTGSAATNGWAAYFTDLSGNVVGTAFCPSPPGGAPPSTAFGIKVTATATSPTYFMGVLGINTATQSAAGTAVVQQILSVDNSALAPWMVWFQDCNARPAGSAQSVPGPALVPGDTVVLQDNSFMANDTCGPTAVASSNSFKGYMHDCANGSGSCAPVPISGSGTSGTSVSSGGNAFGTDPMLPILQAAEANGTPVIVPVADAISGNGTNYSLTISGFVEVSIAKGTDLKSLPVTGTVVGSGVIPFSSADTVCQSVCTYDNPNTTTAITLVG